MSNFHQLTALATALFLGMFVSLASPAAPAPEQDPAARKKFETLKKKVLPVVAHWIKDSDTGIGSLEPEVKLARLIAPTKVNFTSRFKATLDGKRVPAFDFLLCLYLRYYDGRWTTTGCCYSPGGTLDTDKLMLAIDEAGED